MALLSLQQIHKTFEKGTVNENHVLRGLDLDIEQGDFISVIGGNGAGKSTLMNLTFKFLMPVFSFSLFSSSPSQVLPSVFAWRRRSASSS